MSLEHQRKSNSNCLKRTAVLCHPNIQMLSPPLTVPCLKVLVQTTAPIHYTNVCRSCNKKLLQMGAILRVPRNGHNLSLLIENGSTNI